MPWVQGCEVQRVVLDDEPGLTVLVQEESLK